MTEAELAWLAGLLEGEGNFFGRISSTGRICPRVYLGMTDFDVVNKAAKLIGPKTNVIKSFPANPKCKPIYKFTLNGSKAAALMYAILPWMGIRRGNKIKEILSSELSHYHTRPRLSWVDSCYIQLMDTQDDPKYHA